MDTHKTETETKIIEAAREIFMEKGLQGARMQEIADRAGINKALLHYYFRSKDKLFDSVFQETIEQMIPQFATMIKQGETAPDFMRIFITFYNDFFTKNPYMPQFFFHEIWQHPDKLATYIKSHDVRPDKIIKKIEDKLPKITETEFLAQHMVANIMGMCLFPHIARPLFQRMLFDNNAQQYETFLSERTDFLLKMMGDFTNPPSTDLDQNPDDDF